MRGEHDLSNPCQPNRKGSSPHARGAHNIILRAVVAAGIIPACAGSTTCHQSHTAKRRDHPRMRGEHGVSECPAKQAKGSSPHARGAHPSMLISRPYPGIIPACAGSTTMRPGSSCRQGDHPRMRGEHMRHRRISGVYAGSSPHARGAPPSHEGAISLSGIIPACAGSTAYARSSRRPSRDHPRMRGEHSKRARVAPSTLGSSPHARGAHQPSPCHLLSLRIIPACAGST